VAVAVAPSVARATAPGPRQRFQGPSPRHRVRWGRLTGFAPPPRVSGGRPARSAPPPTPTAPDTPEIRPNNVSLGCPRRSRLQKPAAHGR